MIGFQAVIASWFRMEMPSLTEANFASLQFEKNRKMLEVRQQSLKLFSEPTPSTTADLYFLEIRELSFSLSHFALLRGSSLCKLHFFLGFSKQASHLFVPSQSRQRDQRCAVFLLQERFRRLKITNELFKEFTRLVLVLEWVLQRFDSRFGKWNAKTAQTLA